MWRRRLIRSCFLLPLLLCIGGWAWSSTNSDALACSLAGRYLGIQSTWGTFSLYGGFDRSEPNNVIWETKRNLVPLFFIGWSEDFGFDLQRSSNFYQQSWALTVPYWFLLILLSPLLFYGFRKPQPKISHIAAFPVETTETQS